MRLQVSRLVSTIVLAAALVLHLQSALEHPQRLGATAIGLCLLAISLAGKSRGRVELAILSGNTTQLVLVLPEASQIAGSLVLLVDAWTSDGATTSGAAEGMMLFVVALSGDRTWWWRGADARGPTRGDQSES